MAPFATEDHHVIPSCFWGRRRKPKNQRSVRPSLWSSPNVIGATPSSHRHQLYVVLMVLMVLMVTKNTVDPDKSYTIMVYCYAASHPRFSCRLSLTALAKVLALFLWVEFLGVESAIFASRRSWFSLVESKVCWLVVSHVQLANSIFWLVECTICGLYNHVKVPLSNSHVLGSSSKATVYCLCRRKSLRMPSSDTCERRRRKDPKCSKTLRYKV